MKQTPTFITEQYLTDVPLLDIGRHSSVLGKRYLKRSDTEILDILIEHHGHLTTETTYAI